MLRRENSPNLNQLRRDSSKSRILQKTRHQLGKIRLALPEDNLNQVAQEVETFSNQEEVEGAAFNPAAEIVEEEAQTRVAEEAALAVDEK